MALHPAVAGVRLAVRQALAGHPIETPVLVACSGGADSLALAAATIFDCSRTGRSAGLVTVDHGLQSGSAAQAQRVAALGRELGFDPVSVSVLVVQVGVTGGPEGAARTARYLALDEARRAVAGTASPLVLLGHTADDQAETVLLGLGRGSGPRSIAGMRPSGGGYLRPLLGLRRADTAAACEALGLSCWQDPQNLDPRFRRVRLRHEVLPLLDEVLDGGVVGALARTARLLQDDVDALDEIAGQVLAGAVAPDGLPVTSVAGQPVAVRSRVLKRWVEAGGVTGLTAMHVAELGRLVTHWRGQGPIDLPGGYRVRRSSGTLSLTAPVAMPPPAP
jgi:tRNA(Ile)-lysidine synthase